MRIVIALGGNALIRRGQALTVATQRANLAQAVGALAALAQEHQVLITHGNGPQVGLLALQAAAYSATQSQPNSGTPLDVLGAESEGMVGYLIEAALTSELQRLGSALRLATLLTLVQVDDADPAFASPSKPIGPLYSTAQAQALRASTSWQFTPESLREGRGASWRRVVPSPAPQRVLEIDVLRMLLDQGVTVICGGGGGIPVVSRGGQWVGVEAVIDKDFSSSLMARELHADVLLLLTDVPGVARDFSGPQPTWLRHTTAAELSQLPLPAGSMAPKVQAAIDFVQASGQRAAIGKLEDAVALLRGDAGTQISNPR
jgi:carbamate kinase